MPRNIRLLFDQEFTQFRLFPIASAENVRSFRGCIRSAGSGGDSLITAQIQLGWRDGKIHLMTGNTRERSGVPQVRFREKRLHLRKGGFTRAAIHVDELKIILRWGTGLHPGTD